MNTTLQHCSAISDSTPANLEDSSNITHGAYHWDCSDWIRSHNTLPNITEVPGSEIPDSSSFHSQESAESSHHIHSHRKNNTLPPSKPTFINVKRKAIQSDTGKSQNRQVQS